MPANSNCETSASSAVADSHLPPTCRLALSDTVGFKSLWLPLLACGLAIGSLGAAELRFRHFTIADPLPGTAWGIAGTPLADFDGDGDLDTALSRRDAHGFWWYERRSDAKWVQHLVCDSEQVKQSLGATALDVDGDGWTDLVFSFVWFQNPGTLREHPDAAWPMNPFPGNGHDLLAADINGDGRRDIVTFDGKQLVWYDPAHSLAGNMVAQGLDQHGGLTPKGAGDVDGDGDVDLVIAGWWFENPGSGKGTWARHAWPHLAIPKASYGTSIRSWVADLDRDGALDIVYSDCDTGSGHVYWVRNQGRGRDWQRFQLPDPPTSPGSVPGTGSWHSLGVADFDGDGDPDVFAGEQEDPDTYMVSGGKLPMKPKGLKERGVIWINSGANPPTFSPQVIQEDNPGWHDASLGDVDGDGDVDIVSKVWNKDGPSYHADYWRNDTVHTNRFAAVDYSVQLDTIRTGFDQRTCWVHARAGAIPGHPPTVVLTMQKLLLSGSDVFYALNDMRTDDLGKTWTGPVEHSETLGRRDEPGGVTVAACDFWPQWHAATGKLLGIGHTVRYRNNRVIPNRQRETCYSVYDPAQPEWTRWETLAMPDPEKFYNAGAGCVQRFDLPNGEILLPICFKGHDEKFTRVTVLRCAFDGRRLTFLEQGNELAVNSARGLGEPSLTRHRDRYYLTLRHDQAGYVCTSEDGLHFGKPQRWLWNDGTPLGNYNTQQHWVTQPDGLFLVYTRRGANNDHVFRHRAPLFMAQVDPEHLRVLRSTERVLVPERGARLGNFGVTAISPRETWVTVTEWMQTTGPNPHDYTVPMKRGADNAVFVARILWGQSQAKAEAH